ncbi:arginyltransferase [Psychromonas arctica]|uniref:arginyltransferase n=1 Tax=Psychromonas arctica TaxID=168275 RepID=UPI000411E99D|nr:arginyltransferase [Psychromonas arctica]
MSNASDLRVGLTAAFACSYLADKEEQLIMLVDPEVHAKQHYPALMSIGFRRSGDQVYRPHCPECNGCESLRVNSQNFKLSKSQKRLVNKNKHFTTSISTAPKASYYPLYERYINQVHKEGVMYPASSEQFESFLACSWGEMLFVEVYDAKQLISVSVTDQLYTGSATDWSAFYCFYDPDYREHSLGKYAVLQQLDLAKQKNITFLYLGYYIHNCQKMNYKNQFNPHQRFINQQWKSFD